jgi:hypothetical protein
MPTKGEIAEAVERKRKMQSKMIVLPSDCCHEDADRLEDEAQREFPLHYIIALHPVGKMHPLSRVIEPHETFEVCK